MVIMHPLLTNNEINPNIDNDPRAEILDKWKMDYMLEWR